MCVPSATSSALSMALWRPPDRRHLVLGLTVAVGSAYPVLVYVGRDAVPPLAFVALALLLIGTRAAFARSAALRDWRLPLLGAGAVVAVAALVAPAVAARIYPVAMSLATAAAFGLSLAQPTSLVERIALTTEPDLPPAGRSHCRRVTWAWTIWLTLNALIAAGLAAFGNDAAWALWTGILSYLASGVLFAGEWLVRRMVRRTAAA